MTVKVIKNFTENNSEIKQLAVIGGGASGIFAALSAARESKKTGHNIIVTIYESNPRIGKKLLVTGNGRCNFTNSDIKEDNYHGASSLAYSVYKKFDYINCCDFFKSIGIIPKIDQAGRIYPMSLQASSVLDALRYDLETYGINVLCDSPVFSVERHNNGYLINNEYYADACIIATGGKAAPVHGSNGSGFELLRNFNISVVPVLPALSPIVCDLFPKGLKGVRAQGTVSIKVNGKVIARDTGEIQYTDFGLSGIPSMQVSGVVSRALNTSSDRVYACVDSCPALSEAELKDYICALIRSKPDMPGENLLSGIIPKKLGITFLCDCSVNPTKKIGILSIGVIDKIVAQIKNKKYVVKSVKGFNEAQVSCGGICSDEICFETLELKKLKNVFVCGEIVDVDGDCGGYNLQWAWSSGFVAGVNAVREINCATNK